MDLLQFEELEIWFVPDIKDNRKKPIEQQFAVLIAPMNAGDMRRIEEQHGGDIINGQTNIFKRYNTIREQVLTACVRDIKNLFLGKIKSDGSIERTEIKTIAELVKIAGEDVLENILAAIKDQSKLAEGMQKKLG